MALERIDPVSDDDRKAECIDNCTAAAQASEWCATACAREGDEEMSRCIELCRDVADLTTLHARLMARDSEYSGDIAATCADLCEACADECERHDAEHCQTCAEVLRDCVDSCRDMASA